MFTFEDGAGVIISQATSKYESLFGERFPLYEYIGVTQDDDYDFSLQGAKRLSNVINDAITRNEPVPTPSGYADRVY